MDPLAQSVAFAAHSDAIIFLFTRGGLTTGVGAETGGILGEFHLRRGILHSRTSPVSESVSI